MKMLRVSTELDDNTRPDTEEIPSLDTASASYVEEVIELTEAQLVPSCKMTKKNRTEIDKAIAHYNLGIQDGNYPGELKHYITWMHTTRLGNPLTAQPILNIFGWLDCGHSRVLSTAREDIRGGSQILIHLLTVIGKNSSAPQWNRCSQRVLGGHAPS